MSSFASVFVAKAKATPENVVPWAKTCQHAQINGHPGRCTHKIDTDNELGFAPLVIGFRYISSIVGILTAYHGLLRHITSILLLRRRCLHGIAWGSREWLLTVHVLRRVGRKMTVWVLSVDWRRRHGARRTASHLLLVLQLLLLLLTGLSILVRRRSTQGLLARLRRAVLLLLRRVLVRVHSERGGRGAGLLLLLHERVGVGRGGIALAGGLRRRLG